MTSRARAFGAKTFEEEKRILLQSCKYFAEARKQADEEHGPSSRKSWDATRVLRKELVPLLKAASVEVLADREVARAVLAICGSLLWRCSTNLRRDPEVVLVAIGSDPGALRDADQKLLDDKAFVLEAVRINPHTPALECTLKLWDDREFVLACLRMGRERLECITPSMCRWGGNKALVLEALEMHAWALRRASLNLRSDPDVVMKALKTQAERPQRKGQRNVFRFADGECKRDKDLILLAMRTGHEAARRDVYDQVLAATRRDVHYDQANPAFPTFEQEVPWEVFQRVVDSRLATRGEAAPILTVRLSQGSSCRSGAVAPESAAEGGVSEPTLSPPNSADNRGGREQGGAGNPGEEPQLARTEHEVSLAAPLARESLCGIECDVWLLSGAHFSFSLLDSTSHSDSGQQNIPDIRPELKSYLDSLPDCLTFDFPEPQGDADLNSKTNCLPKTPRPRAIRNCQTVAELAAHIAEELPKQTEVVRSRRVFLTFVVGEDSLPVTPWDGDMRLRDLLQPE